MTYVETAVVMAPAPELQPPTSFAPTAKAAERVLDFLSSQINNDNTRKPYLNAAKRFAAGSDEHGKGELASVKPVHVAAFVKHLLGELAPPSAKRHLAVLRMLFDGIKITRTVTRAGVSSEIPDITGQRDRALIGVMVYTCARVKAVLQMKVRYYFVQGRRGWVWLHEKRHELPCHPAITLSARPASRPILRMPARWNRRRPSRTIPRRARRSSLTGARTTFRSINSSVS